MENVVIQLRRDVRRSNAMRKQLSIVEWYGILRAQHHWAIFQAIRYALWLAR